MTIHTHIHKYVSRHIYAYVHVHILIAKRNNFRVAIGTTWTVCLKNDYSSFSVTFPLTQKCIDRLQRKCLLKSNDRPLIKRRWIIMPA